ncbi:MAG: glycosyltransferase family 39 protein [Candidatus Coatesbacteria bacterium]
MTDRQVRGWLIALVWGAAVLSVIGLGRPSLWIDETHSFEFASLPSLPLVLLNAAARDAYPPVYFLLLHAWMWLGASEVWLRLFSVLAHLASIPMIYLVASRLLSRREGLVAAALLAASPFHLAFAREARMYPLVGLLALGSMWGLLAWLQDGSRRGYAVFVAAGLALLWAHYIGALLLVAQAGILWWGGWKRRDLKGGTALWIAITVAGFLPWSPFFLKALATTHGYGAEAPVSRLAFWFLGALGAGFGQTPLVLSLAALTVLVLALRGLLSCPAGGVRSTLAWWAGLPVGLELLSALLGKPVFGERTLIVATPAWLILIACALERATRWERVAGAVLVAGLAVQSHVRLFSVGLPEAPSAREALAAVLAAAKPGDVIVHSATTTYHPVHEYYLPRSGSTVEDFLIEPQGGFRGGRLGNAFRDAWRSVKARLDPVGAIHTGQDPNRITEEEFLRHRFRRVWYLRTDLDGARRQWYVIPSVYYPAPADRVREIPFSSHPRLARAYGGAQVASYPGLIVELYRRR